MWGKGVKGACKLTENFITFSWCLPDHFLGHLEHFDVKTKMNSDSSDTQPRFTLFSLFFSLARNTCWQKLFTSYWLRASATYSILSWTCCKTRLPQLKTVKEQKLKILKGSGRKKPSNPHLRGPWCWLSWWLRWLLLLFVILLCNSEANSRRKSGGLL